MNFSQKQQDRAMVFENILVSTQGHVGIITLNRPHVLNALCEGLIKDLGCALDQFEDDTQIHVIILTGSEKAFAAGADIKEMQHKTYISAYMEDFITQGWQRVSYCRKPIIAAVSGYALGGGCEMAMMCDFIIAADTAKFGQPEITIGTIPGAGGTQRLARSIGKSKAMDMCLTGRMMDADEAERCGLVSRIVPAAKLLDHAIEIAEKISSHSLPVAMMAKECVDRAFETSLEEGLKFERRVFHATFSLEDRLEGMTAFVEKRKPTFQNK